MIFNTSTTVTFLYRREVQHVMIFRNHQKVKQDLNAQTYSLQFTIYNVAEKSYTCVRGKFE